MILTCPSCSASYNVSSEAIGENGRTVRCKKCAHTWFCQGEEQGQKKALEDLISRIQATDIEVDDIVFGNSTKTRISQDKVGLLSRILGKIKAASGKLQTESRFSNSLAGFMCALAAFSVVIYGIVSQRTVIVHVFPALSETYTAAGFPLTTISNANPEESLIIEKATFNEEGKNRQLTGSLINLTSQNVRVPPLKVIFLDKYDTKLGEKVYVLPVPALGKELSYGFSLPVPEDVPHSLSTVKISFTES